MIVKFEKFVELCKLSRFYGLSNEHHLGKLNLANEFVSNGILKLTDGGCVDCVFDEDANYFTNMINKELI